MASYDIYICSHETQSGLGAAMVMLYYGKKCFLSGYNLMWFRELGFVVYDFFECIKNRPEEFHSSLSKNEIDININCYRKHYSTEQVAKKWEGLFNNLI